MAEPYDVCVADASNIKNYLNIRAKEGYRLINLQPYSRVIKDTDEGTMETVSAFMVTMEYHTLPTGGKQNATETKQ